MLDSGEAAAPSTTIVIPEVSRGSSSKRKEKSHQPPAPRGETLCDWAARVSLKGTDSRKGARPQAKPPDATGLREGFVAGPSSSPALAHQRTQGSSKAVSSKSRPLCPETSSSRQQDSRLPGRRSNSGSGEQPLATVKLKGACARPVPLLRLAAEKGAVTTKQQRARRPTPSLPSGRAGEGGPMPGNWEGAGLMSSPLI